MRLNKYSQFRATCELLSILADHPAGMTTTELSGTPHFHGEWTLRHRQIIRLLRASGEARECTIGYGRRTATLWKLKEIQVNPVANFTEVSAANRENKYHAKN